MDFNKIAEITLRKGAGHAVENGLCIMEMVSYFAGDKRITDHPTCACKALTNYAIALNDFAPTQGMRDTLKPLLPLLSGSFDPDARARRQFFLAHQTIMRFLVPFLPNEGMAARLAGATSIAEIDDLLYSIWRQTKSGRRFKHRAFDVYAISSMDYTRYSTYAEKIEGMYRHCGVYNTSHEMVARGFIVSSLIDEACRKGHHIGKEAFFNTSRAILEEAIKLGKHGGLDIETYNLRAASLRDVLGLELVE